MTIEIVKQEIINSLDVKKLLLDESLMSQILDLANISAINLHGGRVPGFLGASTLNWQIINNEKNIYISALKMNSVIDGGPLIAEKKIKISKDDYIDNIKKNMDNNIFNINTKSKLK